MSKIDEIKEKIKVFQTDKFKFDPEPHIYTFENKKLISATTYLQRFTKSFDEDYWSKKKAEENGVTQEEILNEWKEKRDRSCDLGTMVHEHIENFYMNVDLPNIDDEEALERINKFYAIYEERLKNLEPIYSELKIFEPEWGIAGTIDQLFYYEGSVILGDWKTNKKIKTDKDYCFGWLKYPFNNYKENEINKYSLQVSLYRLILKKYADIDVDYSFICHIPPKGEPKIYKLKDFTKELKQVLDSEIGIPIEKNKELKILPKTSNIW